MTKNLKYDIPASIVVFLVALPLCLGVALASGAPLLSGIISGIIGGIVVGFLSKSQTSVSGPAAGLAAVILSAISELGVFEIFLSAVVIAGFIQIILGMVKAGFIADYIPTNVIKGLLAAIGIILILKQIPHAIGFDKDPEDDFSFFQPDGESTFSEILTALNYITPGAVIISVLSIFILFFWDKTPMKNIKFLPASLMVVILGVIINLILQIIAPELALKDSHLVNIPKIDTSNLSAYFHFPNLENFGNFKVWKIAITIAAIASLETLLNIEAVDKLDPSKRSSPPNRELIAQGVGNILAGFLGGIPVTSVIVRSSVNIHTGNKTKMSSILHGVFILVSVLFLSFLLNMIPLASLAAILIMTGYKLAKVDLFKEMFAKGWNQFIPFVITIIAIVFTDLLVGVLIGISISIYYLLVSNFKNPFIKEHNKLHIGEVIKLELSNQVSFWNKAQIKKTLWEAPRHSKILIDANHTDYIDNDVLEIIEDFKNVVSKEKDIQLNIFGLKDKYENSNHIEFNNVIDKETQEKLKPFDILELLKSGNERFISGHSTDKYFMQQINITSHGQNPMAIIIGCMDSRSSPEILFDAGIGDLLSVRIAGNIMSPEIIGSIEIAVEKLGAKLIVVKGHSSCGAVVTSIKQNDIYNMTSVTSKINRAIVQCNCQGVHLEEMTPKMIEDITRKNVEISIADLMLISPYLKEKVEKKEIGIVGAYHDLHDGKVYFDDLVG